MTNKEAVEIIFYLKSQFWKPEKDDVSVNEALDLAIKALEREENLEQAVEVSLRVRSEIS